VQEVYLMRVKISCGAVELDALFDKKLDL